MAARAVGTYASAMFMPTVGPYVPLVTRPTSTPPSSTAWPWRAMPPSTTSPTRRRAGPRSFSWAIVASAKVLVEAASSRGPPRAGSSSHRCRCRRGRRRARGGACRAPRPTGTGRRRASRRGRAQSGGASAARAKSSNPSSPVYPVRAAMTSLPATRARTTPKAEGPRAWRNAVLGEARDDAPARGPWTATKRRRERLVGERHRRGEPRGQVRVVLRNVRGVHDHEEVVGCEAMDDDVVDDRPALVREARSGRGRPRAPRCRWRPGDRARRGRPRPKRSSPMCERSNSPAAARVARCSARIPAGYWIGISQPAKGTSFAPSATCSAWSAVRRSGASLTRSRPRARRGRGRGPRGTSRTRASGAPPRPAPTARRRTRRRAA